MSFEVTAGAQAVGQTVEPTAKCGVWLFTYLKNKYDYVKKLEKNFKELENEERHLQNREADVKTVLAANVGRMDITNQCRHWLHLVDEKKGEIQDLKTKYRGINKWLCGLCPFPSLLRLGLDIVKETKELVALRDQIELQNPIMTESPPTPPVRFIKKHAQKIDDLPSLHGHVQIVEDLLKDDEFKRICIWGPPGVGKTTVMENLHDRVGELTSQFEFIFWVTMEERRCVKKIQRVLEGQLGLSVEKSSKHKRAAEISKELENKSYLLFLDQVSSEINLKDVGIHDDHKCGKVVFACTSRDNSNFCGPTDEEIKIETLFKDDAQKLFNRIVNAEIIKKQEIIPLATLIVNQCGGIPHMIKLIAQRLAKVDDPAIWRRTLSKLQSTSTERSQELDEVCRFFEIPYYQLDMREQSCLLYWAIFPVGYEIHRDYIIECWRAEQIFPNDESLRETRDRGHTILNDFVNKCLLDSGKKRRHYKMYEYYQRAALRLAQCNGASHQLVMREGEKITERDWTNAERVSLIQHKLSTLPDRPQCSGILTLLLQENSLTTIPVSFFRCMKKLRVLDLHDTKIISLPSSISSLRSLKGLYLNDCGELENIPAEIGKLKSLEIFDVSRTKIRILPKQIQKLTNLKCLRVSFEQNGSSQNHVDAQPMVIIPAGTISKLSSLEELSIGIDHSNTQWFNIVDAIVEEVLGLEELTTLFFYFPGVDCLTPFIYRSKSWNQENTMGRRFRSFNIIVGHHQTSNSSEFDVSECSVEKHLRFCAGTETVSDTILQILKHAYSFELIGHQNVTNLSVFGADNLGGLVFCKIEECNEMESIIDGDATEGVAFQSLKKLHIINIPKLVHIWKGLMNSESLSKLTTLILKDCPSLEKIFSKAQGMVQKLSQLQHLEVDNCLEMKEIIETGSGISTALLPKLKTIELRNLPKLFTIWNGVKLEWSSLETIEIRGCVMLKDLPSTMGKAAKLRKITCTRDWKNELNWPSDDAAVQDRFQRMFDYV